MYYLFWVLNCLVGLFIGYLLAFEPNQLATGIGQRAISLTVISLLGFIILTVLSVYFKLVKQMSALAVLFLVLSYVVLTIAFVIFISRQKWM